jgi:hypothetical protein
VVQFLRDLKMLNQRVTENILANVILEAKQDETKVEMSGIQSRA